MTLTFLCINALPPQVINAKTAVRNQTRSVTTNKSKLEGQKKHALNTTSLAKSTNEKIHKKKTTEVKKIEKKTKSHDDVKIEESNTNLNVKLESDDDELTQLKVNSSDMEIETHANRRKITNVRGGLNKIINAITHNKNKVIKKKKKNTQKNEIDKKSHQFGNLVKVSSVDNAPGMVKVDVPGNVKIVKIKVVRPKNRFVSVYADPSYSDYTNNNDYASDYATDSGSTDVTSEAPTDAPTDPTDATT